MSKNTQNQAKQERHGESRKPTRQRDVKKRHGHKVHPQSHVQPE